MYLGRGLNVMGILFMVAVILVIVPLTIPKMFGIQIYAVLTGSMTPTYSIGGVVYVKEADASDIRIGDVITYRMGTDTEYVMTHRVVEMDGSFFVTKGDANETVDPEPVAYNRLIGKVVLFIPGLAGVSEFVNSTTGRSVLVILFASAFILWIMADIFSSAKEKETEHKPVKKKRISILIQGIGGVLILGAVLYIGSVCLTYQQSASEYKTLESEIFAGVDIVQSTWEEKKKTELTEDEKVILERINKLHEENSHVVGWIRFDNLELSYPIMQGEENEYYLSYTFSGEKNSAGSIFMEAANTPDFEDSHTIIYGHNMKNGSMFGVLKSYKTQDFYPENEYFTIYTLDKVYRYKIFAYYDVSMYSEIYDIGFTQGEKFQQILDNMCRRSYYDTQVEVESSDKIVTLSTCSTKGNRFVMHAKRVSEKDSQ